MAQIRLSEQIIPAYWSTFNDTTHMHKIYTSGRAGTKSSRGAIRGIYKIVSDPTCSVVVLRKYHNKLKKTVFKECLRAMGRLGLSRSQFKITVSPMEITYKKYGTTLYFTGSDSIDDTKGMIDEEHPIKLVILDELTEFFDAGDGEDELANIEATFVRGNDAEFCMEYYFNPPKNPKDPIMQWTEKMCKRADTIRIHTTYQDVPISWLGQKLIASAEAMKEADPIMYDWMWLGKCTGLEDVIYYMFDEKKHVSSEYDWQDISYIGIGVDYGQMNATTYEAYGVDSRSKRLQGLGEYYWSGRESQQQRSPSEYARDFAEFKRELEAPHPATRAPGETNMVRRKVISVFIDPSARGLAEEIKRVCPDVNIIGAQNAVQVGIQRQSTLLSMKRLVLDPKQKRLIDEMAQYKWDSDQLDKGKEVPVKQNDHCQDATRYLVMGFWSRIVAMLPMLKQYEKEVEVTNADN